MDFRIFFIYFLALIYNCYGVPPSPTDRLWEELFSAKSVMNNIATQLEKFNSLYLTKLEQKMNLMSTTLTSIDTNIKNLQERAHVWDTFQLHVSAWNEQINTLDKKVEIISKGQEKMLTTDTKMNSISNIEYKTERIISKLDDNAANLQTVIKIVENQHDPLLGEFTTRGVLSTLKTIERKLDKLQINSQSLLSKQINDNKKDNAGKLLIKCNTPPIVEELLSDVASKVDVMFDKFTRTDEQNDGSSTEQENSSSGEVSAETKTDPDLKLIKSLLKRLNQPCKRTIKVLETLETSIKTIDNTTIAILEDEQLLHTDLITFCRNNDKKIQSISLKTSDLIRKIDDYLNIFNNKFNIDDSISNYFAEQREHFRSILTDEFSKNCQIQSHLDSKPSYNPDASIDFNSERKFSEKSNCDELSASDVSGVYVFGRSEYKNAAGRSLNVRYCEIKNGESWTVIQRRGLNAEVQKFNVSWSDYKDGFGLLDRDFWFGNDFIHILSDDYKLVLRVELEDFDGNFVWAEYGTFVVGNEEDNYRLNIGDYRGNASDSFSTHDNSSFSTYDRTNDEAPACCPCSTSYGGGWWFYSCFEANLNGIYYKNPRENEYFRGLIWEHWLGNYSLKKTKLMVRPKSNIELESDLGSGKEPESPEMEPKLVPIEDPFEIPEDP